MHIPSVMLVPNVSRDVSTTQEMSSTIKMVNLHSGQIVESHATSLCDQVDSIGNNRAGSGGSVVDQTARITDRSLDPLIPTASM